MPPKKRSGESFYETFVGEYVEILTKLNTTKTITNEDGQQMDITMPLIFEGYFLDEDDSFYFLGKTPDHVSNAVKKDTVSVIQITEMRSEFDDILDGMPDPQSDTELN